jgi:hypothetical protein
MSLMSSDIEKCMNGSLKPQLRLDYTNRSMYNDLPHVRNLVLLWCESFFGEYFNTLTSLFVIHRVVFDIEHMRQFDEVCEKIYDKYQICDGNLANQAYIRNLFVKLVERMASHYQSAIVQEAIVVLVQEKECVPQEARVVAVSKEENIVEEVYTSTDMSSFDGSIQVKLVLQSGNTVKNFIKYLICFPFDKLESYVVSAQFMENHNFSLNVEDVANGLLPVYQEYYSLLDKIIVHLNLSSQERRLYALFKRTIFYDYRNHIVFTNFQDVNSIVLEDESFASFFKLFLGLSSFSYSYEVSQLCPSFYNDKFKCIYSHFVSYYKYGFSFDSLMVLKSFKSPRSFEKLLLSFHLNGTCVVIEVFLYNVCSANHELFVADYYDNNRNWHAIFENYSSSVSVCDIRFYYLVNTLRLFWPGLGEGFMDGDEFTELFDFVLYEVTKSEFQPQFVFVVLSHGTCCQPSDDGYISDYHEPVSYQSNSEDDPPYLREYSSDD